jgi:2-alkyl-3-oxoalkanoate reductase
MRLAIIGAAGFLGRATVESAVQAGLQVRALVRPGRASTRVWRDGAVEARGVDLHDTPALTEALRGCDVVINLVVARQGTFGEQMRETQDTTTSLVRAAQTAGVRRLIGVSSFSVYDFGRVAEGACIDETCPLIDEQEAFGAYAQSKRLQETLLRAFEGELCIVRPGILYGVGALWHAAYGRPLGAGFALRMGPADALLPVIYVHNCADALVCAALAPGAAGVVANLVDDDLPARAAFFRQLIAVEPRRTGLVFPMFALRLAAGAARSLQAIAAFALHTRMRMPTVLSPQGRSLLFKPFSYDNRRAREAFGWRPRRTLSQAMADIRSAPR